MCIFEEEHTLDALEAAIENKLTGLDSRFDKYIVDEKEDERKGQAVTPAKTTPVVATVMQCGVL
ncbi:MAG: hypothetical protein LBJ17_04275 [Dysgonamonadaceae bacterium]|nr:hypothetical protein [Dysgonamonadaceae bacterium]